MKIWSKMRTYAGNELNLEDKGKPAVVCNNSDTDSDDYVRIYSYDNKDDGLFCGVCCHYDPSSVRASWAGGPRTNQISK